MPTLITTAGLALIASGSAVVINEARMGRSTPQDGVGQFWGTESAILAATDIRTPAGSGGRRRIVSSNPIGRFSDALAQYQLTAPVEAAAYTVSEIGLFASGTLFAYRDEGSGGLLTVTEDITPLIVMEMLFTNGTPTGVTFNSTFQLIPPATRTAPGAVQLAADGDSTSTGAVVLSPAQVAAIAAGAAPSISFASFVEINNGTVNDKAIPPGQLERSQYKRVILTTQTAYDATNPKDSDVLYVIAEA